VSVALPIVLGTAVVVGFGIFPTPLLTDLKDAAVPMLTSSGLTIAPAPAPGASREPGRATPRPARPAPPVVKVAHDAADRGPLVPAVQTEP
jgi:NADH-quinone oxidoreductase subunit N